MLSEKASQRSGWIAIIALGALVAFGCAASASIDMTSFDPSQDQVAIAENYRREAMAMRQKAESLASTAARYERLFGPHSDLVSGARLLSRYYAEAAQELDRLAHAHEEVARPGRRLRQ